METKHTLQEQAFALGQIFRVAAFAARPELGPNDAEMLNACLKPFVWVPQMIALCHKRGRLDPATDDVIGQLMGSVDLETMVEYAEKPLPMDAQGSFMRGYMQGAASTRPHGLQVWRKMRKLTQSHLAQRVGVSLRYYQKLEAGESNPTVDVAKNIAAQIDCMVEDLF